MASSTLPSTLSAVLAALALTVGVAGCGTSDATPVAAPAPTTTTTVAARPTDPVDRLVTTERGRLHLHCAGTGPTTVLLLAGWGAAGDEAWAPVLPALSEETRACTYDRLGTGTSDPATEVQTFRSQTADLAALLEAAGEPGPYLLVGHSFGGAQAVTFAAEQADQVTGLVLVDASPTTWPDTVCAVPDDGTPAAGGYQQLCAVMHDPTQDPERLDVFAAFGEAATVSSLDDLPMTVITAVHRTSPGLDPAQLARLDAAWSDGTARWAQLSSSSTVVPVDDTSHYIQHDHPDVVLAEVARLLR